MHCCLEMRMFKDSLKSYDATNTPADEQQANVELVKPDV